MDIIRSEYLLGMSPRLAHGFTSPFGHYHFKVLCLGLSNAPSTFQSAMNHIFRVQIAKGYVVVYLDDILIYSKSAQDHERHLDEVLGILEQNELYAKLTKCDLNKPELVYLGHFLVEMVSGSTPRRSRQTSACASEHA